MNHRPRQPGNAPSRQDAQNAGGGPSNFPPQTPPQQRSQPHPQNPQQTAGQQGQRPVHPQQQARPVPGQHPQQPVGGPPPQYQQRPQQSSQHQQHAPGINGAFGNTPPQGRMPPTPPKARTTDTEFGLPTRSQKPIPASVPAVDVDAIAQALDVFSNEMDALERTGQVPRSNPEPIDDLFVADMYTPKEQIPVNKRQQAAQKIAWQGPVEEGQSLKQNDLINALMNPAPNMRPAPLPEHQQPAPQQPAGRTQPDQISNGVSQSGSARQQPSQNMPNGKAKPTQDIEDWMLDAFEAAMVEGGTVKTPNREAQKKAPLPAEEKKSDTDFNSRLMPKNDAYTLERNEKNSSVDDSGMTVEELHALYAAQKTEVSAEEAAAQEAFLAQRAEAPVGQSGFLQGLGSGGAASNNSQFPLPLEQSQGLGADLSTSGGFLAGLDSGGSDQQNAIATRDIFSGSPGQSDTLISGQLNESQPAGSSFLDSLSAFNPPQEQLHHPAPVQQQPQHNQTLSTPPSFETEPGTGEIWNSGMVSPAAKAYRDSVLYGDAPPLQQQQQQLPPQQPVAPVQQDIPAMFRSEPTSVPQQQAFSQPTPQPAVQQQGRPSFLDKPALHQTLSETPDLSETPSRKSGPKKPARRKMDADERKRRRAIKNYFGDKPVWSLVTAFMGLCIMASQYRYDPLRAWVKPELTWYLVAGGVLFLVSVLWRYLRFRKPREETLDDWIAEDLVKLEKHALDQMQLQNRYLLLEPVIMSGFPDLDSISDEHVTGLYGRDHVLRYTPRAITVMCFTREEILTYEGAIDLTTGEIVYENTKEFFYADVATIGMVKSRVKGKWRLGNIFRPWRWFLIERFLRLISGHSVDKSASSSRETFVINLKSGSKVQLILRDSRILRDKAYEEVPLSTDDKVLKAITEFVVAQKTDQLSGYR